MRILSVCCLHVVAEPRTFAMFFMVLDLRLVKIGCRETINFFVCSSMTLNVLGKWRLKITQISNA